MPRNNVSSFLEASFPNMRIQDSTLLRFPWNEVSGGRGFPFLRPGWIEGWRAGFILLGVDRWAVKFLGERLRSRVRRSRNMQASEKTSDFWGSMVWLSELGKTGIVRAVGLWEFDGTL